VIKQRVFEIKNSMVLSANKPTKIIFEFFSSNCLIFLTKMINKLFRYHEKLCCSIIFFRKKIETLT